MEQLYQKKGFLQEKKHAASARKKNPPFLDDPRGKAMQSKIPGYEPRAQAKSIS